MSAVLEPRKLLAAFLAMVATLLFATSAFAGEEPEAFARVVVDTAELRTGPSISSRTIYTAHRDETFAVDGRQGTGF